MDAEKSDFGKFPAPTTILRTITQKDPDLVVDTTQRAANGEQTAHVVGKRVGAVKALQHRALASLRRLLEQAVSL